jgi:micrococcal nuclease
VDGDTFIIDMDGLETRIRLIGVDTPESVHPNKDVEAFGLEASAFLKQLLAGQAVSLGYDQANAATSHRDKYKRLLAYAYRISDSLFINAEIIKQGFGHAYTVFPFQEMQNFLQYEREARAAKRGLWQDEPDPDNSPANSKIVYANPSSQKYHRKNCRYASTNSVAMPLAEARQRGYSPCKICKP